MALTTNKFIIPDGSVNQNIQKMTSSSLGPAQLWDFGIFDYRDTLTATTPVALTGGSPAILTNNSSTGTFKSLPDTAVTDLWISATDKFDFSELNIGDMVEIRLDCDVTTTQVNQDYSIDLELAQATLPYTLPIIQSENVKTVGSHSVVRWMGFYMKDLNTINGGAQFIINSASNLTVRVYGWYIKLTKKGR